MIELRHGSTTVSIDPDRGGRLASYCVRGREIVVPPPDPFDETILWGSFLMAPWAGRIAGAEFEWDGRRYHLPAVAEGHAIHGVGWDQAWTVERTRSAEATVSARLQPGGWPFPGTVRQTFELEEQRLVMTAEILAEEAMPAAIGWHPWFRRTGEDPRLQVLGSHVLETRDLIPTGRVLAVDPSTDLRAGPEIGLRLLDHCYPDVESPAIVTWPDLTLEISFRAPVTCAVVHTRAASFCVEPQTAWPNAVALEASGVGGTGLVRLAAGDRLRASMAWRWWDAGAGPR
jgi:galactose mutarotase-like enzyme